MIKNKDKDEDKCIECKNRNEFYHIVPLQPFSCYQFLLSFHLSALEVHQHTPLLFLIFLHILQLEPSVLRLPL